MSTRHDACHRGESPRRRALSRRRQKRGRSESIWSGARRICRIENDASEQVKILEEKNNRLANTINGLRATLDLKHVTIENYKAKIERLENRCEELSVEMSQAVKRIAIFEYHLKEKQHEENALREAIVAHAKSLLGLVNRNEKLEVAFPQKTNVFNISPSKVLLEAVSLADGEQSREVTGIDLENKEKGQVNSIDDKREKQATPSSGEMCHTEASSRSPSLPRFPSPEPVSFSP